MGQCALNGVQHVVQALAEVFGEEAENETPTLLERGILAAIAPVCVGICQVLSAVQLNYKAQFLAERIHFRSALTGVNTLAPTEDRSK